MELQNQPIEFLLSSDLTSKKSPLILLILVLFVRKINGRDAAKQLDITLEKVQQIIEEQFDLSGKPMMQKIILNNKGHNERRYALIYIFQDSL